MHERNTARLKRYIAPQRDAAAEEVNAMVARSQRAQYASARADAFAQILDYILELEREKTPDAANND